MKSQHDLKTEARELVARLELSGKDPELLKKLQPLVGPNHLQAGDLTKLAVLLGYSL